MEIIIDRCKTIEIVINRYNNIEIVIHRYNIIKIVIDRYNNIEIVIDRCNNTEIVIDFCTLNSYPPSNDYDVMFLSIQPHCKKFYVVTLFVRLSSTDMF